MTCAEARELFSALADEALAPDERAALDRHLAGCAECREELQRFRSVVSLVRAVQPERAPVGFVDRVLDRTGRAPWYRRLLFPLSQKIPLGVAAAVLVGVLVSLLYRASPELDQLARRDVGPPRAAVEAPAAGEAAKSRAPAAVEAPVAGDAAKPQTPAAGEAPVVGETRERQAPAGPPPVPPEGAARAPDALRSDQQHETPERSRAEPRESVSAGKASEPAPRAKTEANQPVAGLAVPEPHVAGRLTVNDVAAAERALGDLVSRSGGWQTGRRSIADGREVDVSMPRAAVDEFLRELARLGSWQAARAAESPGDPARILIQLVR
jgi:hypothetical protein